MATATNPIPSSSSAHHSPRSPNSRWASAARGGSSPWTQIVRDCDSEYIISSSSSSAAAAAVNGMLSPHSPSSSSVVAREANVNNSSSPASSDSSPSGAASKLATVAGSLTCPAVESGGGACAAETQPESTDNGGGNSSGNNANKKPVWNKPSNGATAEISAVMGAVSWPALSESTRASPKKSPSSDSLKALSDGPVSLSQGTGVGFSSTRKQDTSSNTNPNFMSHNAGTTRQRSMKRGGGGMSNSDGSANDNFSQSLPSEGAVVELASNNLGKSSGAAGESSVRDNTNREGGHRGGSHGGNVLQQQRNSFRRGNGGPHPRGDVSHHHGHGGRRDRDRGNQDWDTHRRFGGREGNMPQQRVTSRPFIRGPVPSSPYIPPPPLAVRPFAPPMVYTEVPSPVFIVPGPHPDSLRAMPMVPISPMFFPLPDPHLSIKIVKQIDYYFSSENLVKDTFLRQNMDEEGWVPIQLIAGFKKVMELTDNIQLILEAIQASNVVEVQVDKVRRKNDWMKWIMPPVPYSTVPSQPLHKPSHDTLAEHLQSFTLDEKALSRSSGQPTSAVNSSK
ncbi:La-related protein 1C [Abeliophyllum distichum]|uniref:La-related protein 1C n=1 Tax=Abeliophyllum distichum TaxID=126358 RepID=A0ABD1SUK7_9LAMI